MLNIASSVLLRHYASAVNFHIRIHNMVLYMFI